MITKAIPSLNLPPILSTGGFNKNFLRFVSGVLDCNQIIHMMNQEDQDFRNVRFEVKAIDYINKTATDCFFRMRDPTNSLIANDNSTKINEAGKIELGYKPVK